MPVPVVVYVVATVGTVGAILAFKEFVYGPHIAPAIGRWREERRIRRNAHTMMHRAEAGSGESHQDDGDALPLLDRRTGPRVRRSSASSSRTSSSDEGRGSTSAWGVGSSAMSSSGQQAFRNDGLTLRRPRVVDEDGISTVELDALSSSIQLGSRRIVNTSTIDEAIHHPLPPLPYIPLSPQRTHVLLGSASTSPLTSTNPSRQPSVPTTPAIHAAELARGEESTRRAQEADQLGLVQPLTPPTSDLTASTSGSLSGSLSPSPVPKVESPKISPLPFVASASQSAPLVSVSTHPLATTLSPPLNPTPAPSSTTAVPSPPQYIPSLSQSYPQDLDYEHGLELLSPPSSRSESPFDVVNAISPLVAGRDMRLPNSPLASPPLTARATPAYHAARSQPQSTSTSTPTFFSAATSPVSSISHPLGVVTTPFAADANAARGGDSGAATPQSMTSSSYLSLTESTSGDEAGDEDDEDNLPLARGHRTFGQPLPPSVPTSDHGLGLSFIPPSPQTSEASSAAHISPSRRQPPSGSGYMSNSDLSDLDFLSDYALSEGELVEAGSSNGSVGHGANVSSVHARNGRPGAQSQAHGSIYDSDMESDASWSVAGGSDVGDETMQASPSPHLGRDGTLRGRRM